MTLAQALQGLLTILGGSAGVWLSVELVKRAGKLHTSANAKLILRSLAGLASAIGAVLINAADGELDPANVQNLMTGAVQLAAIWWGAHAAHQTLPDAISKDAVK